MADIDARSSQYFFEQIVDNEESAKRIEIQSAKDKLSEKRRIFRNKGGKLQFLSSINDNDSFSPLFKNIERELKKSKESLKQIKEALTHKKESKRKTRRNTEKLIAQIFALKEENEQKRANSLRLSEESEALQSKHENGQISEVNNGKYPISDLIDPVCIKQIIQNQEAKLSNLMIQSNELRTLKNNEYEINKELVKKSEEVSKESQTFSDMLSIERQQKKINFEQNEHLLVLQRTIKSMQSLLRIKEISIKANKLCFGFECEPNEIYQIEIRLIPFECEGKLQSYSIESVEVIKNNTKYAEIVDYVLSKYETTQRSENKESLLVNIPLTAIKRIVIEICMILKKLPQRYGDINALSKVYGGNDNGRERKQEMLPWLVENAQLVFKFEFKQNVTFKHDEDEKVEALEITVDVPLVIVVSWNYPQHKTIKDTEVISVEHFNCSTREQHSRLDGLEIEGKWNEKLKSIVEEIKGKYQDDVIGFVNYIHRRLQEFSNTAAQE